jgi:hypothetical protein
VDGPDVYAVCHLGEPSDVVARTLRATDPSAMYNALLVEPLAAAFGRWPLCKKSNRETPGLPGCSSAPMTEKASS